MAGEVGSLSAIITANAQGLFTALDRSEQRLKAFGQSVDRIGSLAGGALAGLGAGVSFGAFTSAIKAAVDDAGRLVDVSSKLGIGAGALEQLELAAKTSGIEAATLHAGIGKLEAKIGEAARGSEEARKTFTDLGLSWQELATIGEGEAFVRVGQHIGEMGTGFERADAAMKLMGKGGRELIPLLRDFTSSMDAAGAALTRLTDEGAQKLDKMGDAWELMKASASSAFREIVVGAADLLTEGIPSEAKDRDKFLDALFAAGKAGDLEKEIALVKQMADLERGIQTGAVQGSLPARAFLGGEVVTWERMLDHLQKKLGEAKEAKLEAFRMDEENAKLGKALDEAAAHWQKFADAAKEASKDPLMKLAETIENLKHVRNLGLLSEAEFRRAMAKAEEGAKPTSDLASPKARAEFAANEFGSVGAGSAVNRFLNAAQPAKNMEEQKAIEQRDRTNALLDQLVQEMRQEAAGWGLADVGQ